MGQTFQEVDDVTRVHHVAGRIPDGTRGIRNVTGGRFEGPRLKGTIEVPTGDWATLRADGSFMIDVRGTLRTDDGALILLTYNGIGIRPEGGGETSLWTAPLFETGDARCAWLNRVQAVGIGSHEVCHWSSTTCTHSAEQPHTRSTCRRNPFISL